MRVAIDPELFEDSGRSLGLKSLLYAATRRPHHVFVGGGERGRAALERWLAGRASEDRAPITRLLERVDPELTRFPPTVSIQVTAAQAETIDDDGNRAVVSVERAIDLISSPLRVVLENGINDAAFLRKVAPAGGFRDWLIDAENLEWIEFRHGAGISLSTLLRSFTPWQRLRSWTMCDAETRLPRSISGEEHRQVREFRSAAERAPKVPLHVLERRAIENYLPLPALRAWAYRREGTRQEDRRKRERFVEALRPLDAQRPPVSRFPLRHHYHLERGFGAASNEIPPDYDAFRGDPVLTAGVGSSIKNLWSDERKVSLEGGAGWIKDEWLERDGHRAEIQRIIHSLRSRL